MKLEGMSNQAILQEIGHRLTLERLNLNITQGDLSTRAGIARRTLVAAEAGEGMTLSTFVSILRELRLLDRLDALLPEPAPSPIQLLKLRGKTRQRATGSRKNLKLAEPTTAWKWKE